MIDTMHKLLNKGEGKARWQSGYAADCKSVYTGSTPVRASKITFTLKKNGIGALNLSFLKKNLLAMRYIFFYFCTIPKHEKGP